VAGSRALVVLGAALVLAAVLLILLSGR
jgi:hypothetical protein